MRTRLIFRLEHKDGGGPYFYKDGSFRRGIIEFGDEGIHGCRSLKELKEYFKYEDEDVIRDCYIKIYLGKIIWERKREVIFKPIGKGLNIGIVRGGKWLVFKF